MKVLSLTLFRRFLSEVSATSYNPLSISLSVMMVVAILAFIPSCREIVKSKSIEVAPKPYTVNYAPADGSLSPIDPPAFVWLPVDKSKEYFLQYSRKSDFSDDKTTTISCPRTIYIPDKLLGPGQWYWRFAIADTLSGEKRYSPSHDFRIAENAAAVPFPDIKNIIANLKGIRPRDFVRIEDVKRYREMGKGPLKEYVVNLRSSSDRYINKPMEPEPHFLSKDAEQKKVDFVKVMNSTRAFNSSMITCATTYLLTGEEKYGREARRRLLHLAKWDPNGSTSLFHNDEPGHEIIRVMANTYDWIYPLLSEDDKKAARDVLAIRIPQLYKILMDKPFEIHPYESHAMDYYIGDLLEACICMADELPVEKMLEYVLQQLWSPFFPPYGGEDGGWCEGPSYWQWSTATFLRNFNLVKRNCGVDLTKKPWLENTAYFKLYCNPPYSKMSPFGDGQSGRAASTGIMYKLGVTYNNPYALWYDDQLNGKPQGIERFIYYQEGDDKGKSPSNLPQARCFFNIGLACMHSDLANGTDNVMFLLRSSPFGSISHSYADQNSFVLFAYGEPLAIASGYYPYYASPHHSKWTWETKASNSLLVDGRGQNIRDWNARGKIVDFVTSDYAHYALGDAAEAYGGRLKSFLRHSLFLRPTVPGDEPIVILYDEIVSPKPSTFDWLLHSLEQMQIDEATETINIRRGSARLRIQFLTPTGLKFSQTDTFNIKPESDRMPNQWHLNAETVTPSTTARFVTVLMPYREGQEAKLPKIKLINKSGWMVVELTGVETRQMVAFRAGARPNSELKIGNFETKSSVAASAYDMNGILRASMHVESKE